MIKLSLHLIRLRRGGAGPLHPPTNYMYTNYTHYSVTCIRSEKGSPAPSDISDADAMSQKCYSDIGTGHNRGSRGHRHRPNHLTVVNPYDVSQFNIL